MATRPPQDAFGSPTLEQSSGQNATAPAVLQHNPDFAESIGLGFERSGVQADWGNNEHVWTSRTLDEMREQLRQRGHVIDQFGPEDLNAEAWQRRSQGAGRVTGPYGLTVRVQRARQFWQAWQAERQRDPNFGSGFGDVTDYDSMVAHANRRRQEELARIDSLSQGGSAIGGFIGQVVGGFRDPISWLPIAGPELGAGRSVVGNVVRSGVSMGGTNMAITAVEEPFVRRDAARIGQERTGADFLYDEFGAAVGGFALGAGSHAAPHVARAIGEAVAPLDRRIAGALEAAPVPDMLTPDQQAIARVVGRAGQVYRTSPFTPGPAGDAEHAHWLDAAGYALTGEMPPPAARAPRPISRADVAAGTADLSGVRNPAFEQFKALIRHSESAGNDNAHNPFPGQTAAGRYQFTDRTWLTRYRQRYGHGDSDAAALARKHDPAIQEVLMDDALAGYAARLRRVGAPVDAGNLYLMHALGEGGGEAFLRADPHARAIDVYRSVDPRHADAAMRYNPFLRGTVADTIRWMHERTGGHAPTPFTPNPEIGEVAGEAVPAAGAPPALDAAPAGQSLHDALGFDEGVHPFDERPVLRPEHFASPEEHARAQLAFEARRDAMDGFAQVRDPHEIPFDPFDHLDRLRAHVEQRQSLRPEAVAEALGVSADEARQALRALADSRDIAGRAPIVERKDGRFQRTPPPPPERPATLLDFLSRRGGIEDVGGEYSAMDAELWHRQAPFRKKLLRERSPAAIKGVAESPAHGEDAAFAAAIDAGYFPQHAGLREHLAGASYEQLPDLAEFREAVDRELRGHPLHLPEDFEQAAAKAARAADPELAARMEALAERLDEQAGHKLELSDGELARTLSILRDPRFQGSEEEALHLAADHLYHEAMDEALAQAGKDDYRIEGHDSGPPTEDRQPGEDDGRSPADAGPEGQGGALARHDEADPESGAFEDPVTGEGAKAQSDSLSHDLEMLAGSGDADARGFRLDEEGDEADIAGILDELRQEEQAAAEMRACMKPGEGGGE